MADVAEAISAERSLVALEAALRAELRRSAAEEVASWAIANAARPARATMVVRMVMVKARCGATRRDAGLMVCLMIDVVDDNVFRSA